MYAERCFCVSILSLPLGKEPVMHIHRCDNLDCRSILAIHFEGYDHNDCDGDERELCQYCLDVDYECFTITPESCGIKI